MSTKVAPSKKRSVGRPRRITLEDITEAGCAIGLNEVDMASVAKRLGIGVATLYGYVDGREHLVRLVAAKLAHGRSMEDRGQSWEDVLREHAQMTFEVYRSNPQIIALLMSGLIGDLADTDNTDVLLSTLIDRGVAARDAFALFLETNKLVIGAAVGATYVDSLVEIAESKERLIRQTRTKCEERGLNGLGVCLETPDLFEIPGEYREALEELIAKQRRKMSL